MRKNMFLHLYLRVELGDWLHGGSVNDRLDLTKTLVFDDRFARVCRRQQAAARWRHEDARKVIGVVEPGAEQVILWTGSSTAVQLHNTHNSSSFC